MPIDAIEIPLLRGGRVVSSLAGAFGHSLRETRLTAMLGYVIASNPDAFRRAFGFIGSVSGVSIEERNAGKDLGRCDIRIRTSHGDCVVEAKANTVDPHKQCAAYPGRWRVLLTNHVPRLKQRKRRNVRYLNWTQIAETIGELNSNRRASGFVSIDLLKHLREHNMIKKQKGEAVEVYAREINHTESLDLFMKARVYRCWYKESSRLPEALYFAPHFGQNLIKVHPELQVGISYVARIETVDVVETWEEFRRSVRTVQGAKWWGLHKRVFEEIRWRDTAEQRSIVFLGEPQLVFNPPVKKEKIQGGTGWLSKKFLSFEELFQAWKAR